MPKGEGWFIDLETGEHISIHEHKSAVLGDPARYRVTADEVKGKNRDEILSLVLSRGFVRVRADKEWLAAEFNAPTNRAFPLIKQFLREKGFVGYRRLRIRDHGRGRQLECTAEEFLSRRLPADRWNEM